jgi:hypothetical protein
VNNTSSSFHAFFTIERLPDASSRFSVREDTSPTGELEGAECSDAAGRLNDDRCSLSGEVLHTSLLRNDPIVLPQHSRDQMITVQKNPRPRTRIFMELFGERVRFQVTFLVFLPRATRTRIIPARGCD